MWVHVIDIEAGQESCEYVTPDRDEVHKSSGYWQIPTWKFSFTCGYNDIVTAHACKHRKRNTSPISMSEISSRYFGIGDTHQTARNLPESPGISETWVLLGLIDEEPLKPSHTREGTSAFCA